MHETSSAASLVGTYNTNTTGAVGWGEIRAPDSYDHTPGLITSCTVIEGSCNTWLGLWIKHDIEETQLCGLSRDQVCSWYSGVGVTPNGTLDAWGVWAEEDGHAQNITHHVPPGHSSSHGHTMDGGACFDVFEPSGFLHTCTYEKRGGSGTGLQAHEASHACDGYRNTHPNQGGGDCS